MNIFVKNRKTTPIGIFVILLLCFFINADAVFAQKENLNVFQKWVIWNNPGSLLIHNLIGQAYDYYDIRDGEIAKLRTKSEWLNRQALVRDKLMELVGPFPEKTPLNPKITGVLQRDGYRVEKIVYESMPNFYVTGCLFIPDKIDGKAPAVLNVIGHSQEGFRGELYQDVYLNLAKKGIIVLAIDPIGQGEHVQYYDPKIKFSSIGYSVIEHCYSGNQCFLSGYSVARFFIWDGIRGIDYLLTRDDVDPERIGVTGFSGGGTVTSYISAFDDRVKVSVPCSWATASRRQVETKGAQDAETIFVGGVAEGITFEDLLEVRAPKPTLMTFTSRDEYLSIQGARESFREIKKAYKVFGREDNLELVEDDFKHWMTPKIRLKMFKFFMKHFDMPGDPAEEKVEYLSEKELTVTPKGQISTSFGGDFVFDVNKRETEVLMKNLEESRKNIDKHLSSVVIKAKEISGYAVPYDNECGEFLNGRYQRDGYTVGMYAIKGEGDYVIPLLLFVPDDNKKKHPALVYLHPDGKAADALPGGEIEKLVKKGYIVAATDVLGIGETKNTAIRAGGSGYTAVLIGRSIVGIQAGDIVRSVNYLKSLDDVDKENVGAAAVGVTCLPLIHAAAFDASIDNIVLIDSPISYRSIVMNRFYKIGLIDRDPGSIGHPYEIDFSWGIAGVLTGYDLPDLIGCIAPRKVVMAGLQNEKLEPASEELIETDTAFPRSVYSYKNVPRNLKIISSYKDLGSLVDWGFE
ncbi:alpha/beta hydrolase family protein [candidate division KSB1 bacterium]